MSPPRVNLARIRERFSMMAEKRRRLWDRTASMFRAREGSLRVSSKNSFRAKKKARVSSSASALAGKDLPVKTAAFTSLVIFAPLFYVLIQNAFGKNKKREEAAQAETPH
jgi:hypothetical protein